MFRDYTFKVKSEIDGVRNDYLTYRLLYESASI